MESLSYRDKSAIAVVSVMLAAAISSASLLLRAEGAANIEGHRFVGTMPEAASIEELPPQS